MSMEIEGIKPRFELVGILSCPAIRFFPLYISHPLNKFNLGSVYYSARLRKQAFLSALREHMVRFKPFLKIARPGSAVGLNLSCTLSNEVCFRGAREFPRAQEETKKDSLLLPTFEQNILLNEREEMKAPSTESSRIN